MNAHGPQDDSSYEARPPNRVRSIAIGLSVAVAALWFLHQIVGVILLTVAILVLAVVVNAPVSWLERRGWKRGIATLAVILVVLAAIAGVFWLIVPRVSEQASQLVTRLPELVDRVEEQLIPLLSRKLDLDREVSAESLDPARLLNSAPALMGHLGSFAVSIVGGIILTVLLLVTVVYIVLDPRPILSFYLRLFPFRHRDAAARAFATGSRSVVGWIWSNVIIGTGEAIAATVFLSIMGVPGAFVWGLLAFFAELVPKVGGYLMAVPPVLVALAIDPVTAGSTALFYIVMQTIAGDVIAPKIRSDRMNLHPVYLVVMMLVMGSAFGILGAVLATPVAGFVSAYFDEFHANRQMDDGSLDSYIERMIASETVSSDTSNNG